MPKTETKIKDFSKMKKPLTSEELDKLTDEEIHQLAQGASRSLAKCLVRYVWGMSFHIFAILISFTFFVTTLCSDEPSIISIIAGVLCIVTQIVLWRAQVKNFEEFIYRIIKIN